MSVDVCINVLCFTKKHADASMYEDYIWLIMCMESVDGMTKIELVGK